MVLRIVETLIVNRFYKCSDRCGNLYVSFVSRISANVRINFHSYLKCILLFEINCREYVLLIKILCKLNIFFYKEIINNLFSTYLFYVYLFNLL